MKAAVLGIGGMGMGVMATCRDCGRLAGVVGYDIAGTQIALACERGFVATTDLDGILNDPAVGVVFVTASNNAHKPLVMAALRAGKAVMCEKPIATTLEDAREMVDEAERRGLFFQIGFELRYSKLYTTIKNWIDQGLLGPVMNTQCTYICSEFHNKGSWRNRLSTGGGMFGEKLSHYVDLPRWWIGSPVTEVHSVCAPNVVPYYEVRDNYHTVYRFANGAVSELTFHMAVGETFAGDPLRDQLDQQKDDGHALRYLIVGTRGAAATDVFFRRIKRWEFGDSPTGMTSKWVEDITWNPKDDQEYYHNTHGQNLDIICRVLAGQPPRHPARDAYETMRLVEAAERSADSGNIQQMAAM
ncbi:MAG: 1,5-anhydro-D-fructose reductase [Lentisphaerae bacterium ADurb.BinA184]|nr:MAG: 1,5-anhydro-D-fructose reductase [Lentisphaerae bacterium ADurb.BinA184]